MATSIHQDPYHHKVSRLKIHWGIVSLFHSYYQKQNLHPHHISSCQSNQNQNQNLSTHYHISQGNRSSIRPPSVLASCLLMAATFLILATTGANSETLSLPLEIATGLKSSWPPVAPRIQEEMGPSEAVIATLANELASKKRDAATNCNYHSRRYQSPPKNEANDFAPTATCGVAKSNAINDDYVNTNSNNNNNNNNREISQNRWADSTDGGQRMTIINHVGELFKYRPPLRGASTAPSPMVFMMADPKPREEFSSIRRSGLPSFNQQHPLQPQQQRGQQFFRQPDYPPITNSQDYMMASESVTGSHNYQAAPFWLPPEAASHDQQLTASRSPNDLEDQSSAIQRGSLSQHMSMADHQHMIGSNNMMVAAQVRSSSPMEPPVEQGGPRASKGHNFAPPMENVLQQKMTMGSSDENRPWASDQDQEAQESYGQMPTYHMKPPSYGGGYGGGSGDYDAHDKKSRGVTFHFGGGPLGGGSQLITSPMGIFKNLMLPLMPSPRANLNGKIVLGVVLEKNTAFGAPAKKKSYRFWGR